MFWVLAVFGHFSVPFVFCVSFVFFSVPLVVFCVCLCVIVCQPLQLLLQLIQLLQLRPLLQVPIFCGPSFSCVAFFCVLVVVELDVAVVVLVVGILVAVVATADAFVQTPRLLLGAPCI